MMTVAPMTRHYRLGLRRVRARGLSLVELMVGVTIGLFVVAAASMLVGTQLGENRKLVLETQLQQDLRATADIIARELRRSGVADQPWTYIASETGQANYSTQSELSLSAGNSQVNFRYDRNNRGIWGFQLSSAGAIRTLVAATAASAAAGEAGGWQELTDPETMRVTNFQITPHVAPMQVLPCPKLCPGTNDTDCWPRVFVRSYTVTIEARSPRASEVMRSLQSEVRLRNDRVQFLATGPSAAIQACPS
jgi:type II secretory pathway component PulJ